jgi:FKBP-type peptidyl-prolyl cis-trans isomerase
MRLPRILSVFAPLAFVACLNGTEPQTYPLIPIENTTFASNLKVDLAASTKTASGLYYRDIVAGTGKTVAATDSVKVFYQGALTNGQIFDQNIGQAAAGIRLGKGAVIKGWDEGLVGMKVTGTRQLIIPPSLAYGSAGAYPAIPPNAVLVFNVTVSEVVAAP